MLLDVYRLTGNESYGQAAAEMIDQFVTHADERGRPATRFAEGQWQHQGSQRPADNVLSAALAGTSGALLVRMMEKYEAVTRDPRYGPALTRWAETVDEDSDLADQLQIDLMVAAHRATGEAAFLGRAIAMTLRGLAATEPNREWHQCSGRGRYGFKYLVESLYHPILAAADYGARGGIPVVGLAWETNGRPGLPRSVAVRSWQEQNGTISVEVRNQSGTDETWRLRNVYRDVSVLELGVTEGRAETTRDGEGWAIKLPGSGAAKLGCKLDRPKYPISRGLLGFGD